METETLTALLMMDQVGWAFLSDPGFDSSTTRSKSVLPGPEIVSGQYI
jgi:hypothetical protein